MIPAGQFIQQINRHACFFMTLNGTCKKTGGSCVQWNTMDDCDEFVLGIQQSLTFARQFPLKSLILKMLSW